MTIANKDNVVTYDITLIRKPMVCPVCGGTMIGHGHKTRIINHPVLREYACSINYHANRYLCKECKKTIIEDNPFTFDGFNSSYLLLRNVMNYLKNLNYTLEMISKELHISPTQINTYLDSYIVLPRLELPEWIGIDEFHSPRLSYKHSSYLCVLIDGNNRCLYDVLGSRSKNYLDNHFSAFPKEEREKVKYVTIDLWEPYRITAKRVFPNCIVAADPFHYVKHLCDDFEKHRINLMNQCIYGSTGYYLLKKWNWLLSGDDVFLDNERVYNSHFNEKLNRRDLFNRIEDNFPTLKEAYYLKERFRKFVKEADYETAVKEYDTYLDEFRKCNIAEFKEFTNILENWKEEILNSFLRPYNDHKLSNALTENYNGKINTYISLSKGISNFERFRKRVLFALNPKIFYSLTSCLKTEKRKGKARGSYKKNSELPE